MRDAMEDDAAEKGLELVLDNRKLIIGFALLILVCGSFFVVGFVEGKRQSAQQEVVAAAEVGMPNSTEAGGHEQEGGSASGNSDSDAPKEGSVQEQLDWYKSVNSKDQAKAAIDFPKERSEPVTAAESTDTASASPSRLSYSVQVGAFRQREEAGKRARELQSKGYECRVESPHPPEQLYLLKVGMFASRAEAVALQLRLKKDGFSSFVKTN